MRLSIEKVIEYMSTISFSDALFFCALLVLIALILILIYMLKKGTFYVASTEKPKAVEEPIQKEEENDAPLDLQALTKALESATPKAIELTPYEEEQEEKAIISYDELLQARKDYILQYDEEKEEEGVLVKKVDLEQLSKDTLPILNSIEPKLEEPKESIVISYEKEEAFLAALKQLQSMLNE